MSITITEPGGISLQVFKELEQGTPEWFAERCGIVTASIAGHLVTKGAPSPLTVDCPTCPRLAGESCVSTARKVPTPIKTIHPERAAKAATLPPVYGPADNDTSRTLTNLLVAERITGHVVPGYTSAAMERGHFDEPFAREAYNDHHAPVAEVGFMVRDDFGFRIGYSPDGLVGDNGLIEIKSREPKIHLATILADAVPAENMAQCQTGLLVSGREWLDYVSFCGGMPLWTKRVYPDPRWHDAIVEAVALLEHNAEDIMSRYLEAVEGLPMTERIEPYEEMRF